MKKHVTVVSLIVLAACSGGSGTDGAPGKSAYQIWLDQGNVGTEQDFLDSIIGGNSRPSGNGTSAEDQEDELGTDGLPQPSGSYKKNLEQSLQGRDGVVITEKDWSAHGGFKSYEFNGSYVSDSSVTGGNYAEIYHYVYNEKELNLVNYGVYLRDGEYRIDEFDSEWRPDGDVSLSTYIHNREGIGANVYKPSENTVFKGGTLAYLYNGSKYDVENVTFIKGDAEYTYSATNPILKLDFENYYSVTVDKDGNISVAGSNNTGKSEYDLSTGVNINEVGRSFTEIGKQGFVKKGEIEEVAGTYNLDFREWDEKNRRETINNVGITGAFGGQRK